MRTQTTVRILLHGLFRRKRMLVGLTSSILGTILLGSLLWPPSYEASSSVIIRGQSYGDLLFPQPGPGGQTRVLMEPQEEVNTEIEIIRSRPVLERVVKSLELHVPKGAQDGGLWATIFKPVRWLQAGVGLVRELPEQAAFEAAVTRLGKQLRVEAAVESQIVRIIYRHSDPVIASQVVNRVTEEYLHQHLAINLNRTGSTFYAEQIKTIEDELAELQDQLVKVKNKEGIISFAEQSKALVNKLETFDVARTTAQKEIISKRSKVERIRELQKSNPDILIPLPEMAQDLQIRGLENRLVTLNYQLGTLGNRYTENSRQVVAAREQLKQIQAQIKDQVDLFLEREVAELRKLEAEEQALSQTIGELDNEIKRLTAAELALSNWEKQIEDKQDVLTVLRKKHADSLVAQATDFRLENVKIVSRASVPLKPVVPNLPLNLTLGLILALVVSFSAALFVEYWDDSLRVPEDVERFLGRPVFASVPEL